jgi:hypothetical protein
MCISGIFILVNWIVRFTDSAYMKNVEIPLAFIFGGIVCVIFFGGLIYVLLDIRDTLFAIRDSLQDKEMPSFGQSAGVIHKTHIGAIRANALNTLEKNAAEDITEVKEFLGGTRYKLGSLFFASREQAQAKLDEIRAGHGKQQQES